MSNPTHPFTDAEFAAQFPTVFRDLGGDPTHTCMAWGLEIPPAWRGTVWALCETIASVCTHLNHTHPELQYCVVADQIKEKWGGLRFYWHGETAGWDQAVPPQWSAAAAAALASAESEITGAVECAERVVAGLCHRCGCPTPRERADPDAYPWHNTCEGCAATLRAENLKTLAAAKKSGDTTRDH